MAKKIRCPWGESHPLYVEYHDREWGLPLHNDQAHFELLVLEGMQAGLSWLTVLKKRENFRRAFDGFQVSKVAGYRQKKIQQLLRDEGIIRNRLKIEAAIQNAKCFLQVQKDFRSFDRYIWQFVQGKPIQNRRTTLKELPAKTEESDRMSKDLQSRGFRFVGSTICYAWMQAAGLVNDHLVNCFRYRQVQKKGKQRRS